MGEERDTRRRLVTVHMACDAFPSLRTVIEQHAEDLGLDAEVYGNTLTILTTK